MNISFRYKIQVVIFLLLAVAVGYADDTATTDKPTRHDRIYHLQHRLYPGWTHQSEGKFYRDLLHGSDDILLAAAARIVDDKFSKRIVVQRRDNPHGILLIFPVPVVPPECYFVFITTRNNGYRYMTYEKTHDLNRSGDKGVVGEWMPEGDHHNYGARKYEDPENFILDIIKMR